MEIHLGTERISLLKERSPVDDLRQQAMDPSDAGIRKWPGSLLQRPKPDRLVLLTSQRRIEPFWHVTGRAQYVYERSREYSVTASAPEVRSVTIEGQSFPVSEAGAIAGRFTVTATEHCREDILHTLDLDARSGAERSATRPRSWPDRATQVPDPSSLAGDGAIVIAPEQRASFVVRRSPWPR